MSTDRERLATALAPKLREAYGAYLRRSGSDADWLSDADWITDALLPVVQALVAEGAAKELRAAADTWLHARADELDPS